MFLMQSLKDLSYINHALRKATVFNHDKECLVSMLNYVRLM